MEKGNLFAIILIVSILALLLLVLITSGFFTHKEHITENSWERKQRLLFFALPWGFKNFRCNGQTLFISDGFFIKTEEQVNLYRVRDISFRQNILQRLFNLGTLDLKTSDSTAGNFSMKNVKDARLIRDLISKTVEEERDRKRVGTRELMGNDDFDCENDF